MGHPADALTPALPAALREILDTPKFRDAAREAARLYAGVDGAARAAAAIVDYLGERAPAGQAPAHGKVSQPSSPRAA